jgi:hypothetical protein
MRVGLVFFRDDYPAMYAAKMSSRFFNPLFRQVLDEHGIGLDECWADELMRSPEQYRNRLLVFVYREAWALENLAFGSTVEQTEQAARENDNIVLHDIGLGRLIGDKSRTNRVLSEAGIPVPKLVTENAASFEVFSNQNDSTHAPVLIHEAGAELDLKRYNTAYVDTTRYYKGEIYYVVLRAMCVGEKCTAIYVRLRHSRDGDPSVHATDTPVDADLLNHLHRQIVTPQKRAITELCEAIGKRLGLAFFAHDILPSNTSEDLYVCETNFKFDLWHNKNHLAPLGDRVPHNDHVAAAIRSSHAFVDEARKLGYL